MTICRFLGHTCHVIVWWLRGFYSLVKKCFLLQPEKWKIQDGSNRMEFWMNQLMNSTCYWFLFPHFPRKSLLASQYLLLDYTQITRQKFFNRHIMITKAIKDLLDDTICGLADILKSTFFFIMKISLVTEKSMKNVNKRLKTYANAYAVFLLSLWKLHNKLWARFLLGIIQRPKSTYNFNWVLGRDFSVYRSHYCT